MSKRPSPVYFQHLRKTAGTSLFHHLVPFFRPERIARGFPKEARTFKEAKIGFDACDLITDHANILWAAPADGFKVSVFRNPLQRLLSERREWMQQGPVEVLEANPKQFDAITTLQKRSMVDVLAAVFEQHPIMVPGFWNHQALTMAGSPLLRIGKMVSDGIPGAEIHRWLIDNKQRIAQHALVALRSLSYVGLTEDFEVSAQEILARIGLPEPGDIFVRNARNPFDDERDPRIEDVAQEFLELDNELYEEAVELHAVFGRTARGTPVDYIGRVLTAEAPLVISAEEAPGSHGWRVAHRRSDGLWSRWSAPGEESRIALSAEPGIYSMRIEAYGGAGQGVPGLQIEIDRQLLATEITHQPDGLWTVTATFERARHDRFDIVFRCPDSDPEYALELKQISLQAIKRQSVPMGSAGKHALRPVYFQHLKRTGGRSLTEALKLFFRPESIAAGDRLLGDTPIDVALAGMGNCSLVTDHGEILSTARPDAFKVAVFRDPMARLLSERRRWMQPTQKEIAAATPAVVAATTELQDHSMVDILESVFRHPVLVSSFWNHQALTLGAWPLLRTEGSLRHASAYTWDCMHEHFGSGSEFRAWLAANKARIARNALQSLKALDYVGLTEDLDNSVQEIFARIGLPEPKVVIRNVSKAFDDEDDPRIKEAAQEFLELDNELYEAAAERHAVSRRVARGTPVDYIARVLTTDAPLVVSSHEAPGGHGWHPANGRRDGTWSRWSGPGRESRFAVSAPPGTYLMKIEIFGAASEKTLRTLQVEIEGRPLSTEVARSPSGLWTVSTSFERIAHDRFDIVLRFPGLYREHGLEMKQISFLPVEAFPSGGESA